MARSTTPTKGPPTPTKERTTASAPRAPVGTPPHATSSRQTRSYRECFEALVGEARALPDGDVKRYRSDARLARYNVCLGADAVLPHAERIARELPAVSLATLARLPDLARAVVYAHRLAQRKEVSDGELQAKSSLIAEPRQEMLASAKAFARRGVFDPARVRAIEAGTGRIDQAEDVVELIQLFTDPEKQPALRGKHPFTEEDFRTWRAAAEFLLEHLQPSGTAKRTPGQTPEERDVYALWTLLLRDHVWLRKAGHYLFDETDFEVKVPRVLSRTLAGVVPAEEGEEEPAPRPA